MEPSYQTVVGSDHIVFYEFRGIGVPPDDLGRAGDIFWDTTFPYILYVRRLNAWEAWNPRASEGSQLLVEHPCFYDRYLWLSGSGLSWLAQQSLGKSRVEIKQFQTLGDELQKELAAVLCSSPGFRSLAPDILDNRTRHDAEVTRRTRNGILVGKTPYFSTVSSPLKRKRSQKGPDFKGSISIQSSSCSTPSRSRSRTHRQKMWILR
ncbi:hypothetical protein B0H15DRAFT_434624 [Mycena belliarum]|uniref:Uncharacterized protein n=1 Tax=Mycena belliarum TaxID=1033014 RepID=A0AAD6TXH3_9AGAR|nr:hypothetical protein B0H15DRAFT_434624 [Mycena belliae]